MLCANRWGQATGQQAGAGPRLTGGGRPQGSRWGQALGQQVGAGQAEGRQEMSRQEEGRQARRPYAMQSGRRRGAGLQGR